MSDDKASDNLSILVGIVLLAALGWGLVSLWGARHAVWQRVKETNMRPLAIATQPEGAAVVLDGRLLGASPVRVLVEEGAHTASVRLRGYEAQSRAFELKLDHFEGIGSQRRFVAAAPWVVNLTLRASEEPDALSRIDASPIAVPGAAAETVAARAGAFGKEIASVKHELRDIRSLIIATPEQSLSYGILKGRVDAIERENVAQRDYFDLVFKFWFGAATVFGAVMGFVLLRVLVRK